MKRLPLEKLIENARRERAPSVEVADSVLATLREHGHLHQAPRQRPLLWMSLASSAAAAAFVVAAVLTWQQRFDAVNGILEVVTWAAQ